jgi:hypothetical protein
MGMIHYFLIIFIFILLSSIFWITMVMGQNLGLAHLKNQAQQKLEVVLVAEGAVFGLLGLLIAFTFSGAYDRFEYRKLNLVEESYTFEAAYNYIDLLPNNMQTEMRNDVRLYAEWYIKVFKDISYESSVSKDLEQAQIIEDRIWKVAVAAAAENKDKALAQVYLPAFMKMFDAAHTGYYLTQIHPPRIIFVLLIGLAAIGAFLVGYNSAENKQRRPIHSLCYVLLTAFTIYIIINMEYPRIGFIGMKSFDQILMTVRNNMV